MPQVYLTTAEVAEVLKVSPETVVNYCRRGDLDHIKIRRQYRIAPDALAEFMARGGAVESDAQHMLNTAIAEGRLPAEPPAEVLGQIATIIRQHYAEQADRDAG